MCDNLYMNIILANLKKNTRIDNYLSTQLTTISRSVSKRLILEGLIKVNEKKIKPSYKINDGDTLFIDHEGIKEYILSNNVNEMPGTKMNLEIIFEDENSIIINKESGVVVHPSYNHLSDTLMNGLSFYNPLIKFRPVHRLDKETSGIILFSKNIEAHNYYSKQFKQRTVEKIYYALVDGNYNDEYQLISSQISKFADNRTYKSTDLIKGDYAETEVYFDRFIKREDKTYSLLKVKPKTGRTHQIRVHLSEKEFPIVGDSLYGGEVALRLMLHAGELRIKLFNSAEYSNFNSEIPLAFF